MTQGWIFLGGEVVYRDKDYFGVPAKGYEATMRRGTRAGSISVWERMQNARISKKRAPIERAFECASGCLRLVTCL